MGASVCTDCGVEPKAPRHPRYCVECRGARASWDERMVLRQRRLDAVPAALRRSRVPSKDWPKGRRFCAGCQAFVLERHCSGSRCRTCAAVSAHAGAVVKKYGITAEDYAALLFAQDGRCAICRKKPRSQRLAVDHDHKTGLVRGLLCEIDNRKILGAARDDAALLRRAADYLDSPPAQKVLRDIGRTSRSA